MISREKEGPGTGGNQGPLMIVDGHVDLTYFMMTHAPDRLWSQIEEGAFPAPLVRQAGLRLFANALYCEDRYNGKSSLGRFEVLLRFTLHHLDGLTLIKGGKDLAYLETHPDALGTLLLLENADALAGNPSSYIETLASSGVRIVGLTHGGQNRLADGNLVQGSHGLTPRGREVIHLLLESRFLLDVAHLHPKCFWQLMDLTVAPVVSSHTGVRELCDLPRNLDLNQAREIIGRGGILGVTLNPEMLVKGREATPEDVFIHLDLLVQNFGPGGVAIGSDFCGFNRPVRGLEDVAGLPRLLSLMEDHGYGGDAIRKIMGLNWFSLYRKVLADS